MRKGFTLIEMLVVVLIIGILAAIAWPAYQRTVEASRAVELLANYNIIKSAMERYYLTHGTQTYKMSDLDIETPVSGNFTIYEGNMGQIFQVWNKTIALELWFSYSPTKLSGTEQCAFKKDSKLGMKTCEAIGYNGCCIYNYGTGNPFNPKGLCLPPGRGKFSKCDNL